MFDVHPWRQRNDISSTSQCRHEEDMCANKHPKNDGFIFNGSRDIQQTSTLGLTQRECRCYRVWVPQGLRVDKMLGNQSDIAYSTVPIKSSIHGNIGGMFLLVKFIMENSIAN